MPLLCDCLCFLHSGPVRGNTDFKIVTFYGRTLHVLKGKSVPLQAWSGPEGFRKLRFLDFMTTAQNGGKAVSLTYRPSSPQEMLLVLISVRG